MILILNKMARNTKQKEIFSTIIKGKKSFFNAEDIYEQARDIDESISLATIYRHLAALVKDQQLYEYSCDRRKVYSKQRNHCHFIDTKTGEVLHFDISSLDFLKRKIPGTIESFQIEVKGTRE
ncbi:MAG: Fur family ferric uptake transcriptional regulator [Candidatus Woesearchaeota archaeon]|jgi:Fur family ferric uptake transcriptional regulator